MYILLYRRILEERKALKTFTPDNPDNPDNPDKPDNPDNPKVTVKSPIPPDLVKRYIKMTQNNEQNNRNNLNNPNNHYYPMSLSDLVSLPISSNPSNPSNPNQNTDSIRGEPQNVADMELLLLWQDRLGVRPAKPIPAPPPAPPTLVSSDMDVFTRFEPELLKLTVKWRSRIANVAIALRGLNSNLRSYLRYCSIFCRHHIYIYMYTLIARSLSLSLSLARSLFLCVYVWILGLFNYFRLSTDRCIPNPSNPSNPDNPDNPDCPRDNSFL